MNPKLPASSSPAAATYPVFLGRCGLRVNRFQRRTEKAVAGCKSILSQPRIPFSSEEHAVSDKDAAASRILCFQHKQ